MYPSVLDLAALAVKDGLLRKNVSPSEVMGTCPTGNCTWEAYQSMGVCSDVIDVSPTIISTPRAGSEKDGIPPGNDYSVPETIDNRPVNQEKKPSFSGTVLSSVEKYGDALWVGSKDTANY